MRIKIRFVIGIYWLLSPFLMALQSQSWAEETAVKFAPLWVFRGNWVGSDTYMSPSEAASDYMTQFDKINSQYGPCMATLSQRKPAGCSRVEFNGAVPDSSSTYNGQPWRYLIKTTTQDTAMDGYGHSDTITTPNSAAAYRLALCPEESASYSKSTGTDTFWWCEKKIPLVKKNKVCAGNPINIANGKKQQWETDYSSADGLEVRRYYVG